MSVQTDIRDAAAKAAYDIHTVLGETFSYSNRGAADVTLYGFFNEPTTTNENVLETETALTEIRLDVARQTNFPPTNGIACDDQITRGTVKYYVTAFESDPLGAMWTLTLERRKAETLK
jgi:hypothetical protein